MLFIQLKTLVITSDLDLIRADDKDYFEAVVSTDKLTELIEKIEATFGLQKSPSDKELPAPIKQAVDNLGGIRDDQTLYVSNNENSFILIMFWPWADGKRVTMKICEK